MVIITIIVFLVILTVLVLIHELGHFLTAKFFKIKVEEFGFGLPPRITGKKFGETLYSINWLPIGGFVKLYGEDEAGGGRVGKILSFKTPSNLGRAFFARSWWQRALIIVAGVVMNFLLAAAIFSYLSATVGAQILGNKVIIENVVKGSPADIAGLKKGDIIEYLNGTRVTSGQELINLTKKRLGQKESLMVLSSGQEKTVQITPRTKYPKDQGPMGVEITQNIELKKYPWYQAPIEGFKEAVNQTILIVVAGAMIIGQIFSTGQIPAYSVAGPVGVAQLTGRVVQLGSANVLFFLADLSLNLAIINILPIPALDGGRLFFILIEGITRRKVHPKFESYAHTIGMALLLALIVLITIHDLIRILSGQPILPKQ